MFEVSKLNTINFGATGQEEILQNVCFILSTVKGSCTLDRNFGWDQDVIDTPINFAQSQISANIIEAIESYEPRVQVDEVLFQVDELNGQLIPTVKVVIVDDEI